MCRVSPQAPDEDATCLQATKRRAYDNMRTSYRALIENPQLKTYGHHWLADKDSAAAASYPTPAVYPPTFAGPPQTAFEPAMGVFQVRAAGQSSTEANDASVIRGSRGKACVRPGHMRVPGCELCVECQCLSV